MAPRISLALAIHNHQPVGNFGWVMAEVYDQAYQPMVEALERHPHVRLSLHYSGPLLEWLRAERPDFLDRLRALVDRDQVEILGGGYYEPVLASLPERDRIGQARRMADELESLFGRRPRGAWLAERVWEPDLPTSLVAAGYDWTILDDAHFRAAAIPEEDLWGPYTTEDQGRVMRVFGTEQGLRYRIPFRGVDEVIDHLRAHATDDGERVGMMGDDGEKFGAWPTTWEHSWGERQWVNRFFEALKTNADWLSTTTPSAWLADHAPIGRVYVPTGSYAEMGAWALPPEEGRAFAVVLHEAQDEGSPEARWLRGASWRNFQVRYREINDLHKQMLRVSSLVDAMAAGPARTAALDHLYRGQSNDCYWHGLFGGIYIGHMRLATYAELIAAEDLAETQAQPAAYGRAGGPGPGWCRRGPSWWSRAGGHGGPNGGCWDRELGHPGRSARTWRGPASPSRGVPPDAARAGCLAAGRCSERGRAWVRPDHPRDGRGWGRPGLDPYGRAHQGAGARRPIAVRPVRATIRAGALPGTGCRGGRLGCRPGRRAR